VLPLMLFHQMQLMVCAVIAQRYARRGPSMPANQQTPGIGESDGSA
jgi:sodium/bile acid cotransporter 7